MRKIGDIIETKRNGNFIVCSEEYSDRDGYCQGCCFFDCKSADCNPHPEIAARNEDDEVEFIGCSQDQYIFKTYTGDLK